jgi:MerR HTH family regulatory protein
MVFTSFPVQWHKSEIAPTYCWSSGETIQYIVVAVQTALNPLQISGLIIIVLSMTIIKDRFSAEEARILCGFQTVAMIDYLQRSGVFSPRLKREKRKGKGRRFEFRDLLVLKAIKRLLDSGASVANLKKSLIEFQNMKWFSDPAILEDKVGVIKYLVVSGESVFLRSDPDILVELSRSGQLTFSFIIDLENLHTELRRDMGLPVVEQPELQFTNGG